MRFEVGSSYFNHFELQCLRVTSFRFPCSDSDFKLWGVWFRVGCSCLDHFGLEGLRFTVFFSCHPVSVLRMNVYGLMLTGLVLIALSLKV